MPQDPAQVGSPFSSSDIIAFDRVEFKAGAFQQSLTRSEGCWDENEEWIGTPYRWARYWNAAEQFTPQNAPGDVQSWGEPKHPDGNVTQKAVVHFGRTTRAAAALPWN